MGQHAVDIILAEGFQTIPGFDHHSSQGQGNLYRGRQPQADQVEQAPYQIDALLKICLPGGAALGIDHCQPASHLCHVVGEEQLFLNCRGAQCGAEPALAE
ncbi:hypothetical protein D3C79_663790 [compost metagenome]